MSRVIYTFYRPRSRFSPIFFSFFSLFFFFLKCVRVLCLLVSTGPHLMSSDFTCTNPFGPAGAASGEHVAVMEWRERSAVSCDEAYAEAQRWVEAVTKKKFGSEDFRSALENGVLLCDLINKITPGVIRRVNRLPTPIAGLDNLNVFLKACRKLGLKEAQLFHPGDLQDLSTRVTVKHQETDRRLKNVLITIYWLGRRAQCDRFYDGPFLNLKAFEGLLGTALYKALQESSGQKGGNVRDSGFGDSWCSEREELFQLREGGGGGGGGGHRRDDSLDSLDSLSISSDSTLKGSSEGFCSDAEADSVFRMTENKSGLSYRRSVTLTPKPTSQFNQFLPTKDKSTAYVPAPLRKKRAERNEDSRRSWANLTYAEDQATLTSETRLSSDRCGSVPASPSASPHLQWAYESGSDSDADRPDPDLVLDDLASRRFHSPSPAPPANFAVPASSLAAGKASGVSPWTPVTMTPNVAPQQSLTCLSSSGVNSRGVRPPQQGSVRVDHSLFREIYDDSEDEDDDVGYADPVQDDLYSRKLGVTPQPVAKVSYDKFLPKFWTPEEDTHIQKIKLGSQKRPWYKKMQGFSYKKSGSSSDDSDCDVSPWLSSARSLSGPSPPHTRTHEASAHASLVVGKRQQQVPESIDGSKSASDIQVEPNIDRQSRYEELQKHRQQTKDTEDKWQDDLSKWKNRRRSVNSDIVKKKEEREKTEESTSGSRRAKTFKEMQEERENKGKNSIGGRLGSLSYLDNEDVFDKAVISPRTRTLPARSYTIDTPYYSSESPEPPLKEDEPRAASPATGRAAFPPTSQGVETLDSPAGRDTTTTSTPTSRSFFHRAQSPAPAAEAPLPVSVRTGTVETVETAAAVSLRKVPEPRRPLLRTQTEAGAPSSGSLYEQQPQPVSMEPKPPGVSRVSASLPRSYQKPDSARLTSIVAPRPFGTQSSRLTYVPRALTVDDPQKRVNGDAVASKKSAVPSRFQQFMTSEDELQSQSSSAHSSEDEEEEEEEDKTSPQMVSSSQSISTHSVSSPQRISPVPPQVKTGAPVSPAPAKETSQENFCESRISLNQKPNSSRDFGFQAAWDSTGACVASIQPGSPAEMCQLQAGDEVLTVNGHQVAEMSYPDWKSCMEEALQEGSLIMDIRHHGRNNWDRDQPPMPFKIHKTINLTSVDHPILLGSPDANAVSSSLDFTSHASVEKLLPKEAPAHPVLDMASNGVNGGFREQAATMTNKESEPISLTNLKRRSEFFEKGGSESAMPDIPVPSIIPSSSRWSWDPEEERRRQEKWQKEQERLLQEKYKRDQEKLQEEWLKDQEEVAKSVGQQEPGSLEVSTGAGGPLSSLSPVGQPATPPWEEQERKRKEEHERQRQAEERRKREEEERELRRLQEERETRDRQQRQEEERKSRDEEELRWQRRKEEEREEERRRRQEAEEQQRRERERALAEQQQQQQRAASFANVPPSLSFTDRMKSKSSPQLDEEEKPQRKGVFVQPGVMAPQLLEEQARSARDKEARSQRAASELEMERRNILNIMRYREPERVTGGVAAEKKGQQSASQAEQERQQILNEMKKKTPLLMDKSWIRQQSSTTSTTTEESDVPPMRRGESLDNLDASYNSWRSSWTPRSNSYGQSAARPNSALSGSTAFYGGGSAGVQRPPSSALPSSYSMGSLRAGAGTPSSPWSRQSPSPSPSSPSPTTSPEPTSEGGPPQQRSRSVSGRKVCTFCDTPLGKGAAMIIESLGLCYHLSCFKCIECKSDLGGSAAGAEVRIRNKHLYCNTCYTRCKAGQPTTM